MAMFDSPITTYSDTTPQKRVITDVISLIDPSDVPVIMALGGLDGAAGKFRFVNEKSTVCEWLEDTLAPLTGTMFASAASTDTTLSVADGSMFQEGHIILIGSEQLWVSLVATDTVTVTRAFAGTAASCTSTATIAIVGMARLESDESDDIGFTDRYTGSNYTQILHQEVKVSRTHSQIAQYGIADEMEYQAAKVVPSLTRLLEKYFFYSAAAKAGSATTPRAMAGWKVYITNNLVSGATLAQSQFENAIKAAYADGGNGPWLAVCAPDNLQKIKAFYDNSTYLKVDRTEETLGMVITRILTPFGSADLLLDRWAPTTEIPLLDPKHIGFKTFYPFTREPLAKSGDYDKEEVVGEFTLCIRQDKAHAALTAVS
jgi:hypothetical protein